MEVRVLCLRRREDTSLNELSVLGSPSDLNTGNGTEGAMVCTSLGSLLRPLFYFLCSNLKAKLSYYIK